MRYCLCGKIALNKRNQCSACKSRKYRQNNPLMATYHIKKYNAKIKGKEFNLTFEQFKKFAIKSKYIKQKGIFRDSLHIDRIDETKGYTIDNVQVLTNSQNIRKFLEYKWDDFERKMKAKITINKGINEPCEAF
jgi:hypothetical protein